MVARSITAPGANITNTIALDIAIVATADFLLVILTVTKRAASTAWIVIPLALGAVVSWAVVPSMGEGADA